MDAALRPMLAVPGRRTDATTGFAAELKWDGVRVLVHTDGDRVALRARSGNDITARYPELAGLGAALGRRTNLDGEVVAVDVECLGREPDQMEHVRDRTVEGAGRA